MKRSQLGGLSILFVDGWVCPTHDMVAVLDGTLQPRSAQENLGLPSSHPATPLAPPQSLPPPHLLSGFWESLSSPRVVKRRTPFHLSPLPQLSPPVSPRTLPNDIALRQIGDGSFVPIANLSERPDAPLRSPLIGGEAQRAVLRLRKMAVERCDSARRDLWQAEQERSRIAKLAREKLEAANAARWQVELAERQRIEQLMAATEARLKREKQIDRLIAREEREELYGKKGSGKDIKHDPYAFMAG